LEQSGIYDPQTYDAVITFQERYKEDILDPWGLQSGTGFVYYTTRKKVNDEFCTSVNGTTFPLTDEQRAEIENFKGQNIQVPRGTGKVGNQILGLAPAKKKNVAAKPTPSLLTLVPAPVRVTPKTPNTGRPAQTASAATSAKGPGFWGNLVNKLNDAFSVTMTYER